MGIDYEFIPEYKSGEQKHKSDIISYAGKLLEIVGSDTLIVGVGEDDKPFVWEIPDRLHNALDFHVILTDFLPPWSPGGFLFTLQRVNFRAWISARYACRA